MSSFEKEFDRILNEPLYNQRSLSSVFVVRFRNHKSMHENASLPAFRKCKAFALAKDDDNNILSSYIFRAVVCYPSGRGIVTVDRDFSSHSSDGIPTRVAACGSVDDAKSLVALVEDGDEPRYVPSWCKIVDPTNYFGLREDTVQKRRRVETSESSEDESDDSNDSVSSFTTDSSDDLSLTSESASEAPMNQQEDEAPTEPYKTLFVQGLPTEFPQMALQMLFQQYPGLVEVRKKDGIAFVEFGDEMQATAAMNGLQGFTLSSDDHIRITYVGEVAGEATSQAIVPVTNQPVEPTWGIHTVLLYLRAKLKAPVDDLTDGSERLRLTYVDEGAPDKYDGLDGNPAALSRFPVLNELLAPRLQYYHVNNVQVSTKLLGGDSASYQGAAVYMAVQDAAEEYRDTPFPGNVRFTRGSCFSDAAFGLAHPEPTAANVYMAMRRACAAVVEPIECAWTLNVVKIRLEPKTADVTQYINPNGSGGVTVAYVGVTAKEDSTRYTSLSRATWTGHSSIKKLLTPRLKVYEVASVEVITKKFGADSARFRGAFEFYATRFWAGELNDTWPDMRLVRGSCYAQDPFGKPHREIGVVAIGRAMREQRYEDGRAFASS